MLERFIDYLRASLSASRAEHATLGSELDLVTAYLDVFAVRMGERLRYRIEMDPALRSHPLPPMLLQPLVENAIEHGLEPAIAGGEIVIRAARADRMLCIEVSDDGAGIDPSRPRKPGGGVGLSNLRQRLSGAHGEHASVDLLEAPQGGVTARVMLPWQESHE
jgi:sensor histidine kinase YesM